MHYPNPNNPYSIAPSARADVNINHILRLVYTWMGLGLLATAVMAWFAATNEALASLRTTPAGFIIPLVGLIGTVVALNVGMNSRWLTPNRAVMLFLVFSLVMGFSLSLTFQYFVENEPGALYAAFGTTAALFGAMSVVGFTTRADLTQFGTYLFIGLIGLVIAMFVNMLLQSSGLAYVISIAGVVIFTALTAYDTQKIKQLSESPELQRDGDLAIKFSILGAITLYLDFVNLFLFLLRLLGGRD